jgi:hypothetical protein
LKVGSYCKYRIFLDDSVEMIKQRLILLDKLGMSMNFLFCVCVKVSMHIFTVWPPPYHAAMQISRLGIRIFAKQCITLVAIMMSVKNSHGHIIAICERLEWFGRDVHLLEQVIN